MTRTVKTKISKLGSSNAVIIPIDFLRILHLEPKDEVEVTRTDDGFYIKPVPKWSAKEQENIINDIISFAGSPKDDEPLGEDFEELYCHEKDDFDLSLFDRVGD